MSEQTPQRKITRIERQVKRPERVSIFIDEEFAFGVAEETCLKFSLFPDRELDDELIEEIRRWDESYQARQSGMRYLDRRRRSRYEVETRLREREFSAEAIDEAIAFLEEYGMIDDEAFVRAFIHDRLLRKKLGRRKLASELAGKGVDRDLIDRILDEIVDEDRSRELAREAAAGKLRRLRKKDRIARERSMVTFLQSRGFGWTEIRAVIDEMREEEEDG